MPTLLLSLISFFALIPVTVFAQEASNNLVNLPIGETGDFNDYINAVYLMFISIAALIAVVKIIIAGVKYMFSDIVTQKSDAKNDIKGALLGLLVVMAAVVVLTIINPDLTTFNPDITGIERRDPVDTTESENLAIDTCEGSSVCVVRNCNGDCSSLRQDCLDSNRTPSVIGNNRALACFGAAPDSDVEEDADFGNDLLDEYLAENDDVSNVVTIYAINERVQATNEDVMITDDMIQDWFFDCVQNDDGSDTGNTFVDEQDDQQGIAVRACVN